jgi:hypothetical protein
MTDGLGRLEAAVARRLADAADTTTTTTLDPGAWDAIAARTVRVPGAADAVPLAGRRPRRSSRAGPRAPTSTATAAGSWS